MEIKRRNEHVDPAPNLEDVESRQRERTEEEDEGINPDEELDQKQLLDTVMLENDDEQTVTPLGERDTPESRGSTPVDDEARGAKRKKQYDEGAGLVSEID